MPTFARDAKISGFNGKVDSIIYALASMRVYYRHCLSMRAGNYRIAQERTHFFKLIFVNGSSSIIKFTIENLRNGIINNIGNNASIQNRTLTSTTYNEGDDEYYILGSDNLHMRRHALRRRLLGLNASFSLNIYLFS